MAPLYREFGISRVTGYKIYNRYKDCGLQGLNDRSRAPYRQASRLPYQVERTILGIRKEHDTWGARKIRDKLIGQFPMGPTPAVSTIHAVLDRHGLVKRKKRRRYKAQGTPLIAAHRPNALWCADYKGEFTLGNKQYCYPLTISDYSSRYLIGCEGVKSTKADIAFTIFARAFRDFGLPGAIRTDNGVPFASGKALFGLTRLSVWWLRPGISLQRLKPGHPTSTTAATSACTSRSSRKPPGPRRRLPGRSVYTVSPCLRAAGTAGLPVSRSRYPCHPLRPPLHRPAQNQPLGRVRRPNRGRQRGRGPDLAGELPRLWPGILR